MFQGRYKGPRFLETLMLSLSVIFLEGLYRATDIRSLSNILGMLGHW